MPFRTLSDDLHPKDLVVERFFVLRKETARGLAMWCAAMGDRPRDAVQDAVDLFLDGLIGPADAPEGPVYAPIGDALAPERGNDARA